MPRPKKNNGICQHHPGKEIWKAIPKFEGTHEVSSRGRVRSLPRIVWFYDSRWGCRKKMIIKGRILAGSVYSDGYIRIELSKGKRLKPEQLVLLAFVGPKPNGYCSCHYPDNDKQHNCLENIRWASYTENNRDKIRVGTITNGSSVCTAKLDEEKVRRLRRIAKTRRKYGKSEVGISFVNKYSRRYKVNRNTIINAILRKTWKHL